MSLTSELPNYTLTEPRPFERNNFLENIHFGYENKRNNIEMEQKKWDLGVCRSLPTTT
jgi:hypothetical protein